MSDVNVIISSVDKGIDIMEDFLEDLYDVKSHVLSIIEGNIEKIEENIKEYEGEPEDLVYILDDLYSLRRRSMELKEELVSRIDSTYQNAEILVANCKYEMGIYLDKLNDICFNGSNNMNEYILILDSRKYPETSEHIKYAIKLGRPKVLTLDRVNAALRRREALRDVKRNSNFDRDEYPQAMFLEGGEKSHVFYLNKNDNRGSGAYISLRLRKLKDGTKVRIRII